LYILSLFLSRFLFDLNFLQDLFLVDILIFFAFSIVVDVANDSILKTSYKRFILEIGNAIVLDKFFIDDLLIISASTFK